MEATIIKVDNGFRVEWNDTYTRTETVYENRDNKEGFVNLLWDVIEHFEQRGSRYDTHRVTVGTEPGDKHVTPDEEDELRESFEVVGDRYAAFEAMGAEAYWVCWNADGVTFHSKEQICVGPIPFESRLNGWVSDEHRYCGWQWICPLTHEEVVRMEEEQSQAYFAGDPL